MRIVSLLPSTTEILFDLGAGDDVVGVTFECDHPVEARSRTIVSTSAMPEGLTPAGIDDFVADAMRKGEDLYHLDAGALSGLDADIAQRDARAARPREQLAVGQALVLAQDRGRVLAPRFEVAIEQQAGSPSA